MPNPSDQPALAAIDITNDTELYTMIASGVIRKITWAVLKEKLNNDGFGGTTAYQNYDAGQGFWVFGDAGVVVTTTGNGEFTITVPANALIVSIFKQFTGTAADTNGSNAMVLTWIFQGSPSYNAGAANAFKPVITFEASNGEQYESQSTSKPSPVSVTVSHSTPAAGTFTTTLANLSTQTPPIGIKGQF